MPTHVMWTGESKLSIARADHCAYLFVFPCLVEPGLIKDVYEGRACLLHRACVLPVFQEDRMTENLLGFNKHNEFTVKIC